ncbi:MAG: CDGSH iron-sulfur domain-containing protein [Actinomycetota bacterium]
MANARDKRKIMITRDGPYRVTGGVPLLREVAEPDQDGDPVAWKQGEGYSLREEYRLCRCGRSGDRPYCDGSHEETGFQGEETCDRRDYADKCRKFEGPEIDLTDASDLCSQARFCHREGGTWRLVRRSDDPEARDLATEQACNCPSGRLVAWRSGEPIEPHHEPSIGVVEDPGAGVSGPLWVRGGIRIESADGTPYETRNRVALCRCGMSENKPLCDGSHIKAGFGARRERESEGDG